MMDVATQRVNGGSQVRILLGDFFILFLRLAQVALKAL